MWMSNPRTLILWALLLDAAGQLLILGLILWLPSFLGWTTVGSTLEVQFGWLLLSLLLYPSLDGYSVAIQFCGGAGLLCGSVAEAGNNRCRQRDCGRSARWVINPPDAVWLVHRRVQLVWMLALTGWASWFAWHYGVGCCCLMLPVVAASPAERNSHCAQRLAACAAPPAPHSN